jgi:hypothetical protein
VYIRARNVVKIRAVASEKKYRHVLADGILNKCMDITSRVKPLRGRNKKNSDYLVVRAVSICSWGFTYANLQTKDMKRNKEPGANDISANFPLLFTIKIISKITYAKRTHVRITNVTLTFLHVYECNKFRSLNSIHDVWQHKIKFYNYNVLTARFHFSLSQNFPHSWNPSVLHREYKITVKCLDSS